MKINKINKEQVISILNSLESSKKINEFIDEIYDIYDSVSDGIETMLNVAEFKEFNSVNPIVVILYIINELSFYQASRKMSDTDFKKLLQEEDFLSFICSIICDKYLTNEQLNYKSTAFLNKFNPQISTISLYLNFCLNMLNKKYELNKYDNLTKDMLKNSFSLGQCIINLLINGYDVEAFSTWRTMHENECILYVLVKNGKDTFDSYFKHIEYSLAYRGQIMDKEKVDAIFLEIKDFMKQKDLKSKDMKKFIEYGYLYSVKDKTFNVDFKLNFRDGVETLAGLKSYSKIYELSSEISHSSPLLIFSNREFYFTITMINLFESFFRLETVFNSLFKRISNEKEVANYETLRQVYMKQLQYIYESLVNVYRNKFNSIQHLDNKNHQ